MIRTKEIIKINMIILILIIQLSGCGEKYELQFKEMTEAYSKLPILNEESIESILKEIEIDEFQLILYTTKELDFIKGALKRNNQIYDIGDVSMRDVVDEISINRIKVFNREVLKIQGILGANYGYSNYIVLEDNSQLSRLGIDGNTEEIDIDDDGVKEIITTIGTIPETKIYRTRRGQVFIADINKSINAKSVLLKDKDKKIFEIYFQPNKPKLFKFKEGSLIRYSD